MKIGIIGLMADQVSIIRQAFPDKSIEFLPREREREARDFAKRFSKVMLITKFISHSVQNSVPTHKRVLINGGLSSVKACLNALFHNNPSAPVVKQEVKEHTKMTPQKPQLNSFAKLKNLPVGETIAVRRKPQQSLTAFEANIESTRSYYRRKHGVETLVQYRDGVATLTVTSREIRQKEAEVVENKTNQLDARFWQEAFLQIVAISGTIERAAGGADAALDLYRRRFPS